MPSVKDNFNNSMVLWKNAGWTVEHKGPTVATLKRAKEFNHNIHAIIALCTFFGWLPFWLLLWAIDTSSNKKVLLEIDHNGEVIWKWI